MNLGQRSLSLFDSGAGHADRTAVRSPVGQRRGGQGMRDLSRTSLLLLVGRGGTGVRFLCMVHSNRRGRPGDGGADGGDANAPALFWTVRHRLAWRCVSPPSILPLRGEVSVPPSCTIFEPGSVEPTSSMGATALDSRVHPTHTRVLDPPCTLQPSRATYRPSILEMEKGKGGPSAIAKAFRPPFVGRTPAGSLDPSHFRRHRAFAASPGRRARSFRVFFVRWGRPWTATIPSWTSSKD